MKMKKLLSLVLSLVAVFSLASMPVSASSGNEQSISTTQIENVEDLDVYYPVLDWSYIQSVIHGATVNSSGRISFSASCITYDRTHSSSVTVRLQKLVNGRWTAISTASGQGTTVGGASGTYAYSSGIYRTETTVVIYNASGVKIEAPANVYSSARSL